MYTNRIRVRTHVSNNSVMRDAIIKTCDLHVSILRAGASQICVSYVVLDQQIPCSWLNGKHLMKVWKGRAKWVPFQFFCNILLRKCLMITAFAFFQGPHHMTETRGFCLSEEQTASSVRTIPQANAFSRMLGYNQTVVLTISLQ
jgi:hypothetical protein